MTIMNSNDLTCALASQGEDVMQWFHSIRYIPTIDSTNSYLRQEILAHSNAVGTIVVSEHQTSGKGRLNRTWITPPYEQLAMSFSVDLTQFSNPQLLPLAAGLAVYNTAVRYGVPASLKWPNDVLALTDELNMNYAWGGKLSGILIETLPGAHPNASPGRRHSMIKQAEIPVATDDQRSHVDSHHSDHRDHSDHSDLGIGIIGVGLNYNLSSESKSLIANITGATPPASINDFRAPDDKLAPRHILFTVINDLCTQLTILKNNPAAIVESYRAHCCTLGRKVALYVTENSDIFPWVPPEHILAAPDADSPYYRIAALAEDIDDDGRLLVGLEGVKNKVFTITANDIMHIR